jgi:hypothetical protein
MYRAWRNLQAAQNYGAAESNRDPFPAVSRVSRRPPRQQNPHNAKGSSMRLTLARLVAGLALLTVLAAGCGAASAHHPPVKAHAPVSPVAAASRTAAPVQAQVVKKPSARHYHRRHHLQPPPPAPPPMVTPPPAPPPTMNPIPQGNGGDQDADNNGGPSDGDGNI